LPKSSPSAFVKKESLLLLFQKTNDEALDSFEVLPPHHEDLDFFETNHEDQDFFILSSTDTSLVFAYL
jgi:hypothetical protein